MFSWVTEKSLLMGRDKRDGVVMRIVSSINDVHKTTDIASDWRRFLDDDNDK